jgi:hypothetical protein
MPIEPQRVHDLWATKSLPVPPERNEALDRLIADYYNGQAAEVPYATVLVTLETTLQVSGDELHRRGWLNFAAEYEAVGWSVKEIHELEGHYFRFIRRAR